MNRLKVIFVLFFSLLVVVQVHAQKAKRGSVSITCTCDDTTSKAYLGALHEALAKSPEYREVTLLAGMEEDAIRISIVSLPMDENTNGQSKRTALSIVCLYKGVLVHQFIETCNSLSVASCAESTLAQFDFMKS